MPLAYGTPYRARGGAMENGGGDTTWPSAQGPAAPSQAPHPVCTARRGGLRCGGLGVGRATPAVGLRGCTPPPSSFPLCPSQAARTVLRAGPQPRPHRLQEEPHCPRAHEPHRPDAGAPGTAEAAAAGQVGWGAGSGGPQTWAEAGSALGGCVALRGSLNLSVPVSSPALSE